jgi:DNA polymerase I
MKDNKSNKKLVLLDAHAIIHRAYHALPDFATSKGEPTGALYGLVAMILKIVADLKPDYLVACYDLPKPTYRHEVYDGYKSGRAKTDDNLVMQLEKSKLICEILNIPIYSKEGFEADDMLGTIVEKLKIPVDIIIASGDMDTMQLVKDGDLKTGSVKVYTLKKGINDTILYDESKVIERFGFHPKYLPDFKGLRGDPSDNIIGIAGIGEKGATELIMNFGTIEEIYKKLRTSNSELREKIKPRILKLLEEGEEEAKFSKMLATIRRDAPIDFVLPETDWKNGIDLNKAKALFAELEFRNMGSRLEAVLGNASDESRRDTQKQNDDRDLLEKSRSLEVEEAKVALWVVDSNKTDPSLEDVFFAGKSENFDTAKKNIMDEIKKRESEFVFEEIEKPLISIIKKIGEHGVLIDKIFLKDLGKKYSKELERIEKQVWKEAGIEFNVASPKQLGEILFDKLNLSVKNQKKTAGGAKSTKESELEKMKDMHPIIPLVLEYRELRKLLSTYIEPIPKMLDKDDRLHARFIQTGTTTGRMSSENPNLQNIPIGSDRGKVIRNAFISPKKRKLVAMDYSQIELRISAFLSKDKKLIDIFRNGKDVHSAVASEVFRVNESEVTKEMRRQAKVINFGILYGMGVTALQANLGTDRKTAQEFLNAYFEKFDGLAKYLEKSKQEASELGYTKTFFGRRRYFEGIKSKIPFIRASAERMAINAPIQGTSADIIKIAMKKIDDYLTHGDNSKNANLIMQIHDELIYEVDESFVSDFSKNAKDIMENTIDKKGILDVPIVVNVSVGDNWGEMEGL